MAAHSRAGAAARAAADDPVAAAVRLRRRDPGLAVRLPAVRRASTSSTPCWRGDVARHRRCHGRHEALDRRGHRSSRAVAAIVGYDLIHRMEQGLTYGFLLLFGILTIIVLTCHYPAGSFDLGDFDLTPFLLQFSRRRGLPDQLGDLRLRLLPLPAARRHRPQDLLLDLRRLRARRGLDHVHRLRHSPPGRALSFTAPASPSCTSSATSLQRLRRRSSWSSPRSGCSR